MFDTRSTLMLSTAIALSLASFLILWNRKRNYVNAGIIRKLCIYPIKSLPGIQVDSLLLTKSGAKFGHFNDRSFMLVTKNGTMITIRSHRTLALLKQEIHQSELHVIDPNGSLLVLNPEVILKDNKTLTSTVWGKDVKGRDCGDEASAWFQNFLRVDGVRLMYHDNTQNLVDSSEVIGSEKFPFPANKVRYQDDSACLIINQESVKDLDSRVPDLSVDFRRFRPNILVEATPYDEDTWKHIKINDVSLKRLKYCTRCTATTVNPDTAEKTDEPLKTLKMYRKPACKAVYETHPLFGTNCGVEIEGEIHVGDTVSVIREAETHIAI